MIIRSRFPGSSLTSRESHGLIPNKGPSSSGVRGDPYLIVYMKYYGGVFPQYYIVCAEKKDRPTACPKKRKRVKKSVMCFCVVCTAWYLAQLTVSAKWGTKQMVQVSSLSLCLPILARTKYQNETNKTRRRRQMYQVHTGLILHCHMIHKFNYYPSFSKTL